MKPVFFVLTLLSATSAMADLRLNCQVQAPTDGKNNVAAQPWSIIQLSSGDVFVGGLDSNESVVSERCKITNTYRHGFDRMNAPPVQLGNGTVVVTSENSSFHALNLDGSLKKEAPLYDSEQVLVLPNQNLFTITGRGEATLLDPNLNILSQKKVSPGLLNSDSVLSGGNSILGSNKPILLKDKKTIFATIGFHHAAGLFTYDYFQGYWFDLNGNVIRRENYKKYAEGSDYAPSELPNGNLVLLTWGNILVTDPLGNVLSQTSGEAQGDAFILPDGRFIIPTTKNLSVFNSDGNFIKSLTFNAGSKGVASYESIRMLKDGTFAVADISGNFYFFDSTLTQNGLISIGFQDGRPYGFIEVGDDQILTGSINGSAISLYSRKSFQVLGTYPLNPGENVVGGFQNGSQILVITNFARVLNLSE